LVEGIEGCYFTLPAGVHQITIKISQEGVPSWVVTFCPAAVGGFLERVSMLAILTPYLAFSGIVTTVAVTLLVLAPRKKGQN
jgi:hypothetical protein